MRPPVVWPDPRIVEDFPYDFDLTTHTVYAGLMGSISHGTYVPKEDPDSIDDVDMSKCERTICSTDVAATQADYSGQHQRELFAHRSVLKRAIVLGSR